MHGIVSRRRILNASRCVLRTLPNPKFHEGRGAKSRRSPLPHINRLHLRCYKLAAAQPGRARMAGILDRFLHSACTGRGNIVYQALARIRTILVVQIRRMKWKVVQRSMSAIHAPNRGLGVPDIFGRRCS
jgi:hypothetical protein